MSTMYSLEAFFKNYDMFRMAGHRKGQAAMNALPLDIYNAITGRLRIDCFYARDNDFDVETWLQNHFIFNDGVNFIAAFVNDTLIWEASSE